MIHEAYLTELAEYTYDKIAKVVVNDTLEITDFDIRQMTASTVELEYRILFGSVSEATKIELQSTSGQVLTTNTVFVPITTDTIIKQTLTVKEV